MKFLISLLIFASGIQVFADDAIDSGRWDRVGERLPPPVEDDLRPRLRSCSVTDGKRVFTKRDSNRAEACRDAIRQCHRQSKQPRKCRLVSNVRDYVFSGAQTSNLSENYDPRNDPNLQERIERHSPGWPTYPGDTIRATPSQACFAEDAKVRYKAYGWTHAEACREVLSFCREKSRKPKSCRLSR